MDVLAEKAPQRDYTEIEGDDKSRIYMRCHCGQVIKRRRDSFIPGLHVVICLACHNISSAVELLTGDHAEKTAADHR